MRLSRGKSSVQTSPALQSSNRIRAWWKRSRRPPGNERLLWFLKKLNAERRALLQPTPATRDLHGWLLRHRKELRSFADMQNIATLRRYLAECSEDMVPLAAWLLGRCALRSSLGGLQLLSQHPSLPARRHAARALRRLEAWTYLTQFARANPANERIQWYAHASVIKRPHGERLRSYLQLVDDSNALATAGPSRMPLWFRDLDWLRRPPKSAEFIRRILVHLRQLIHG